MLLSKNKICCFIIFLSSLFLISCKSGKEISHKNNTILEENSNNCMGQTIHKSKISFQEWLKEEKKTWLDKKILISKINNAKDNKEEQKYLCLLHNQMKYGDVSFVMTMFINNCQVDFFEYMNQDHSNSNIYFLLENSEKDEYYKLYLKNIKNIKIITRE